jgi:hypothetical protein
MAGWFDALMDRMRRPRPRGTAVAHNSGSPDSFTFFDTGGASSNHHDRPHDLDASESGESFDDGYDGGESGGGGASSDYGGDSAGGSDSGGGDGGGGDGGGGGGD